MSAKKIQNRAQQVAIRRFANLFAEAAENLVDQHDEASNIFCTASCVLGEYEYDDDEEAPDGVDLAKFIIAGVGAVVS